MPKHLVFYDGECGFCDRVVQILLKVDKERIFAFAPLQGATAEELLKDMAPEDRSADSMVLVENYQDASARQYHIRSMAVFRTCWLLGGFWKSVGWKFYLPPWMFDWFYNIVARNRHRLLPPTACVIPDPEDNERFLP